MDLSLTNLPLMLILALAITTAILFAAKRPAAKPPMPDLARRRLVAYLADANSNGML